MSDSIEYTDKVIRAASKRSGNVGLRTDGQIAYVKMLRNYKVSFGLGPAGTGKTFLAVAVALEHLHSQKVSKIILTRPAIEAGEHLGYLPGEQNDKIGPYVRPLMDSLYSLLDADTVKTMIAKDELEVAPLAYMRGRTFNKSFMILDEAQNTTVEQMKMYLTRLGRESKSVVIGDIMQVDIPNPSQNGFTDALHKFKERPNFGMSVLTREDVHRDPIVQEIIDAYDDTNIYKTMSEDLKERYG